jgi:hypothetical protein
MRTSTWPALAVVLLLVGAVSPSRAWGGGAQGSAVVVAPKSFAVSPGIITPPRAFITPHSPAVLGRPGFVAQRQLFVPSGVVVPVAFVPFRTVHRHLGPVVVFVNPRTTAVWTSGFWCWRGAGWAWVPRTIVW